MAIKTIDDVNLTAIADAIRAKGVEGSWKPSEMAGAINSIQSGGGGGVYIPAVFESKEALYSYYLYVLKKSYSYSNTKTTYLRYVFPNGSPKEYRLVLALYTKSNAYTSVEVRLNDATTGTNFANNTTGKEQLFYINIPANTQQITCYTNLPQNEDAYVYAMLTEDLETQFTDHTEVQQKLVIFRENEVTTETYNSSSSSLKITEKRNIVQAPEYKLISEGGITLADGTIAKDFRGVIVNAGN